MECYYCVHRHQNKCNLFPNLIIHPDTIWKQCKFQRRKIDSEKHHSIFGYEIQLKGGSQISRHANP